MTRDRAADRRPATTRTSGWTRPARRPSPTPSPRARDGRPGPRRRLRPQRSPASRRDLAALDRAYRSRAGDCGPHTIVVSHDAFGYLGRRYGLEVVGITGLSPDAEPSPGPPRRAPGPDPPRRHHHGVLRDARQPAGSPTRLARDLGIAGRGARPDRGTQRRDRRPGLPLPDAAEPRAPSRRRTSAHERTRDARSSTAPSSSAAGRSCAASTSPSTPARCVALLGANGSGKSTLVRALIGLRAAVPRRGPALRHAAASGSRTGSGSASCRSGSAPRPAYPPPSARWSPPGGSRGAGRSCRRAARTGPRSRPRSTAVGLADQARDGVATLSGGQQQRVLIARALAGDPTCSSSTSPPPGSTCRASRSSPTRCRPLVDRGATIVLVAHELGPLAPLVDRARGDARRPDRVRRTSDRRVHRRATWPTATTTSPTGGSPSTGRRSPRRSTRPRTPGRSDEPADLRLRASGRCSARCSPGSPPRPSAPTSCSGGSP